MSFSLPRLWRRLRPGMPDTPDITRPPPDAYGGDHVKDEHFVPGLGLELESYIARQDLTGIHHLIRYRWAIAYLTSTGRTRRLLDLGCGAGYGSLLLAEALPNVEVLGVDYDGEAIATASRTFRRSNLSFRVGDPLDWPATIGAERFDTVVCFDVLEHVAHREIFMEAVVRHLLDEGILLLSTPCGHPQNQLRPAWEHHEIEYCARSLYDFLRRYFGVLVGSERPDFPHRKVFTDLHARGVSYELQLNPVVCSEPIRVASPFPEV